MFPPAAKIVRFPSKIIPADDLACETCGLPKQTASVCRACAFRLVDIALSSSSGDLDDDDLSFADALESASGAVQFRYAHYEVCRSPEGNPWELGRGAMGITYKATDTHLNCPVALKVINTHQLGGPKARGRFLREARTAALLRHPNIASVFHLGLGEEDCFYAMEYIEGETLDARVAREGPISPTLALQILVQCARGLRLAHEQRFIHRDIKPTNIMLLGGQSRSDGEITVKLIDFGLVKAVTDDVPGESVIDLYFAGTPHYASPEQLDSGGVDARSDIYSLGMCLKFMLTGTSIQLSSNSGGGKSEQSSSSVASNPGLVGVPESVAVLLDEMISQNPASRPQTAGALLERITAALVHTDPTRTSGTQGHGPGCSRTFSAAHGFRRKIVVWVAMVAAFVGVAGVAIVVLASLQKAKIVPAAEAPSVSVEARMALEEANENYRKYTKADNQRAIELYRKAIALSPTFSETYVRLAAAYHENVAKYNAPSSEIDLAISAAQRAMALDPKSAGAHQVIGAIRSFQGRPWDALSELHRALELDPNDPGAMCDFALLWVTVGQPQLALPWAKAAAKLQPFKVKGWHAAAEASTELCDDPLAEECYRHCTEIRPTWMSSYCGFLHIHLLQGDFERARQDFAKAESIQSGLSLTLTLNAQIALFSGEYTAAESCYRQLLTINRKGLVRYYSGISYLSALGFLRIQAGNTAEGGNLLAEAEKLHESAFEGPEDIYDLAAVRAVQNRKEDALLLLDQAIRSGWNDYRATHLDPRFSVLREEPRFQRMLADLSAHVAEMRRKAAALCSKPLNLADYPVRPPG